MARRHGAWICFQDESGVSLLPVVRATWAPKGVTPVLRHRFSCQAHVHSRRSWPTQGNSVAG